METSVMEENVEEAFEIERPSEAFVKAVADLLETDATDILSELGYSYGQAVVSSGQISQA